METHLSNNGYKLRKSLLTLQQIREVKDELTVKPFTMNRHKSNEGKFQVFLESFRILQSRRVMLQNTSAYRLHLGNFSFFISTLL